MNSRRAKRQDVRWILAQDFIVEQSGRISGLGLFVADIVSVLMPDHHPGPTPEQPIAVGQLALLMSVPGFEGSHVVQFKVRTPSGSEFEIILPGESRSDALRHNMVVQMNGMLPIDGFGEYAVRASCADLNLDAEYVFEIRRGSVASMLGGPTEVRLTSPEKEPSPKRTRRRKPKADKAS
jgi:hypothetical protein